MAQAKVTNNEGKEEKVMKLTPSKLTCYVSFNEEGKVKGYTIKVGKESYWMDPELTITQKVRDKETKEIKNRVYIEAFKMSNKAKEEITATEVS